MRLSFVLVMGVLILNASLDAQSPKFVQERIDIFLHDDFAEIVGLYYFYNPHNNYTQNSFYYPFVINNNLSYPDSINANYIAGNKEIKFSKIDEGIRFALKIPPKDTCAYRVYYRQKINKQEIEYILTTTKEWNNPLSFAEYYIHVPSGLQLNSFTYNFKLVEKSKSSKIYYLKKENFMPDKNLVVSWRLKK